jgi:hypothetical protein
MGGSLHWLVGRLVVDLGVAKPSAGDLGEKDCRYGGL